MKKVIEDLSREMFDLLDSSISAEVVEGKDDTYEVNINAQSQQGLLIGFRGENISSLETILTLLVKGKTDKWIRILVNVGDYRQKQEEKLVDLAKQTIERVRETKKPQPIYNLTPAQRRVVHLYLMNEKDVVSSSEGEGDGRYLIISPK